MKKTITILGILTAMNSFAGDGHNHEASVEDAPHGGNMRDTHPENKDSTAKRYKAELVLKGDNAEIFIYDFPATAKSDLKLAQLKSTEIKGKFKPAKQRKEKEVVFKKEGDAFKGVLKGASKVHRYDLHVYLIEDGRKSILDFGVDNIH